MRPTRSPLDRLGSELDAAAARQIAALDPAGRASRRGRWWTRHTLALILVVGLGGAGASVAATALLRHGQPVPLRGGKPVAGKSNGAPVTGSVRYLTTAVADPDGGAPWAMRYWTTDRGYACLQVGRYHEGHVGVIGGPPTGRVFHPFGIGVTRDGVSGCYALDGAGHARIALHLSTAAGGGTLSTCQDNAYIAGARGRQVRAVFPPGCRRPSRTIDVGLLGPAARTLTADVGGRERTARAIGPEGAYLVVQRYVRPVRKVWGFRHADPARDFSSLAETWIALTPAAHTVRRVVYDSGTCRVRATNDSEGMCLRHAQWVALPEVKAGDVRAPVRAWAIDHKRIRVRFTARQAVSDRRSGYSIALIPDPRTSNIHHGFTVYEYDHDIKAGETARMTISREAYPAGRFTVRVRFRTAPSTPSLSTLPWRPGPLVGTKQVTIR